MISLRLACMQWPRAALHEGSLGTACWHGNASSAEAQHTAPFQDSQHQLCRQAADDNYCAPAFSALVSHLKVVSWEDTLPGQETTQTGCALNNDPTYKRLARQTPVIVNVAVRHSGRWLQDPLLIILLQRLSADPVEALLLGFLWCNDYEKCH